MTDAATPAPEPPLRRWLRRLAIATGVLAAMIVVAWLAVPPIVRSELASRLTEKLHRKTTIEAVAFDPFRLRVTIRKLAIEDPGATDPLFAIDELVADVSSASIWHRAPVLDALKLVRPSVSLVRGRDGRYSVQDLLDEMAGSQGPTPGFSLNNIEVEDGALALDDQPVARKHRIEKLAVGIPFLSSLPYQTDIRVTPRLDGAFNGSHFALGGSAGPFAERREAAIDVDLDELPIDQYVAYLPAKPRFALAGGKLTTRLKVVFVDGKPGERTLEVRGDARVDGLAVRRRDGSSLVAAERLALAIDRVDLLGREARIASVAVERPSVDLKRLADGSLELAHSLFDARAPSAAPSSPEKPWSATLAKATITGGTIALADERSAFRSTLAEVAVDATNLSTKAGERARVTLAFMSGDRIASFRGEADVEPRVPAASGRFELAGFSLALLLPYYQDVLAVEVQKGSLSLASRFAFADGKLTLADGVASIDDLRLAFPGAREPLWRFPALAASAVDVDVAARSVSIGELAAKGATLRIARERDGTLEATRIMKTTRATGAATTATVDETWTLVVRQLALDRVAVDVEDRVPDPPVKLVARDLSLTVANFTNARGAKSEMRLRTRLGERGRLSFTGPLTTNPFSISGRLDAAGLNLVSLKPYVESRVNVVLTGGALAAVGQLAVEVREGAPAHATWKGAVTVSDFAALDRPTASDLARWKMLALESFEVDSAPFRTSIGRILAEDYYARLIVYQDGTLNFTRLLTPGAAPEPAPDARPAPADAPAREALPISIGKIELVRGNVNFSDFFVRPNYSANLTDVTGTVTGMSAVQSGDIALSARVDGTAPVEVSGRLQPFAKELTLDIAAQARDLDLPPLTPYSIKYAGYGIEKGKLSFDVHYKIENRQLAAQNRLVLDQLTFNPQRVESPTATKLPVLLAVSLLKDRNGVIDLRLPISGSIDDPKFSMFDLIVQVIVNLLGKAATAPFALLTAAFGGGGEELSTVPFAPGSAVLGPDARQRVDVLGKALGDRPALKVDIGGRADPSGDREAMRRASVETALKREKMKSLAAAGTAPASAEQVTIGADERVRWITAAYRESSIKDRPRNPVGMLKEIPPAEMEAMLLADAKVDDDALRLLANARAQAVKDAIAAKGVAGERLFLTAPRLGGEGATVAAGAPEAPPAARVDLALR